MTDGERAAWLRQRIRDLRVNGLSLFEANHCARRELFHKDVDACEGMDDVRALLHTLADQVVFRKGVRG